MQVSTTDYIERAKFLANTAQILKTLAFKNKLVVLTVNNVSADMGFKPEEEDPSKVFTEKFRGRMHAIKPSLGLTWTALINDRI